MEIKRDPVEDTEEYKAVAEEVFGRDVEKLDEFKKRYYKELIL